MTVLTPGCGPNAPIVAGKDARAGIYQTEPTGKVLHTFTLHNTSTTATTRAAARLGLAFLKSDVAKDRKLAVWVKDGRRVPFSAAAATNTWADGSLRSTADGGLVMLDGSLGPGQSRTYEVHVVNGAAPASGFDPFAWLAAHGNDLTVAVTGRTGSATGAKPDLLFSLKTAIATTTRREILCDTDRFVRIKAWQKAPQEEHLICEYHLDFWLDEAGQPFGLEFAPVLTQHWWVANPFGVTQAKERYTYDAVVKYGTTVLDSRARLDHAYYCRWASLRPQDDAQHARKHWIGLGLSQMPTLRVEYDDGSLKRMMKARYIPPLRLGVNYTPPATATYTPLGTNGHRSGINGTGNYEGRGVWGNSDSQLLCHQAMDVVTAEVAWRASRVKAQAGLSVYLHVRDHRSTSSVNGGTDAPNRLIPQTFRKIDSGDQSYAGLGAHCVYSWSAIEAATGLTTLTHNAAVGGTGAFSGFDEAHACNYSGPMAFLEGEAYLGETVASFMNACAFRLKFNAISCDRGLFHYGTPFGTAQGIPTPTTTANKYGSNIAVTAQERGFAWAINVMNHAYMLAADSKPEQPFIKNMARTVDKLLSDSFAYYTEDMRARGAAYVAPRASCWTMSNWMCHYQGMVCYPAARLYDFLPDSARDMTGFEEAAFLAGRYAVNQFATHPYSITAFHSMYRPTAAGSVLPLDEWPGEFNCTISGNVAAGTPSPGMSWTNGDKARHCGVNSSWDPQTALSGIASGNLYYLVNVSGNTFQLSDTEGGEPIAVANGSTTLYITLQDYATITPVSRDVDWPDEPSYHGIAYGAFELAIGEGHSDLDSGQITAGRAFFAPKVADTTSWATFNYDGENII